MTTVERLFEEAMTLDPEEREELLVRLEIAGFDVGDDNLSAWEEDDDRRESQMAAGAPTVPWETVKLRMAERIRGRTH